MNNIQDGHFKLFRKYIHEVILFPRYPTLLVTFINVFAANRRWSLPKALISVLPENIDFFFTRIGGRVVFLKKKMLKAKKKSDKG